MAGSTPSEAYKAFEDAMNQALNCVADGRLFTSGNRHHLEVGEEYGLLLAGGTPGGGEEREVGEPVRLRSDFRLFLSVAHTFVVVEDNDRPEPFRISSIGYSYFFYEEVDHRRHEVLAFPGNKNARPPERTYPHLHVGSVITGGSPFGARSAFRSDVFNKLHIPTGRLSLEAVLMFAIQELHVDSADRRSITMVMELLKDGDRHFHLEASTQSGWDHHS